MDNGAGVNQSGSADVVMSQDDLSIQIKHAKQELRWRLPNYRDVFCEVEADLRERVAEVVRDRDLGLPVVPIVDYRDIERNSVSADTISRIHDRGACVVRGVFDVRQAREWNSEIGRYVDDNGLTDRLARAAEDKYFGTLAAAKPQIYGIYWSAPQVQARQAASLTRTRIFLNHLWISEDAGRRHFDPDQVPVYADRIRRRPPGSTSLGLSPHVDGGSVERWLDDGFARVYRHVFSGEWRRYDPYDAAYRTDVREFPSPAVCSMFRTFQGWTALTRQGRGDGTLQLIPIATGMRYILLRALQDDVPDDDLCGARPGRALSVQPQWHGLLLDALTSIPTMEAGDAVFWHTDVVHAVEDEHKGDGYSNVMYIGATVGCEKNSAYLPGQTRAFLDGRTPPDFAPDNFEVDFVGRATEADLTPLGRRQMGLPAL